MEEQQTHLPQEVDVQEQLLLVRRFHLQRLRAWASEQVRRIDTRNNPYNHEQTGLILSLEAAFHLDLDITIITKLLGRFMLTDLETLRGVKETVESYFKSLFSGFDHDAQENVRMTRPSKNSRLVRSFRRSSTSYRLLDTIISPRQNHQETPLNQLYKVIITLRRRCDEYALEDLIGQALLLLQEIDVHKLMADDVVGLFKNKVYRSSQDIHFLLSVMIAIADVKQNKHGLRHYSYYSGVKSNKLRQILRIRLFAVKNHFSPFSLLLIQKELACYLLTKSKKRFPIDVVFYNQLLCNANGLQMLAHDKEQALGFINPKSEMVNSSIHQKHFHSALIIMSRNHTNLFKKIEQGKTPTRFIFEGDSLESKQFKAGLLRLKTALHYQNNFTGLFSIISELLTYEDSEDYNSIRASLKAVFSNFSGCSRPLGESSSFKRELSGLSSLVEKNIFFLFTNPDIVSSLEGCFQNNESLVNCLVRLRCAVTDNYSDDAVLFIIHQLVFSPGFQMMSKLDVLKPVVTACQKVYQSYVFECGLNQQLLIAKLNELMIQHHDKFIRLGQGQTPITFIASGHGKQLKANLIRLKYAMTFSQYQNLFSILNDVLVSNDSPHYKAVVNELMIVANTLLKPDDGQVPTGDTVLHCKLKYAFSLMNVRAVQRAVEHILVKTQDAIPSLIALKCSFVDHYDEQSTYNFLHHFTTTSTFYAMLDEHALAPLKFSFLEAIRSFFSKVFSSRQVEASHGGYTVQYLRETLIKAGNDYLCQVALENPISGNQLISLALQRLVRDREFNGFVKLAKTNGEKKECYHDVQQEDVISIIESGDMQRFNNILSQDSSVFQKVDDYYRIPLSYIDPATHYNFAVILSQHSPCRVLAEDALKKLHLDDAKHYDENWYNQVLIIFQTKFAEFVCMPDWNQLHEPLLLETLVEFCSSYFSDTASSMKGLMELLKPFSEHWSNVLFQNLSEDEKCLNNFMQCIDRPYNTIAEQFKLSELAGFKLTPTDCFFQLTTVIKQLREILTRSGSFWDNLSDVNQSVVKDAIYKKISQARGLFSFHAEDFEKIMTGMESNYQTNKQKYLRYKDDLKAYYAEVNHCALDQVPIIEEKDAERMTRSLAEKIEEIEASYRERMEMLEEEKEHSRQITDYSQPTL